MTDTEQLLALFESGRLCRPAAETPNIVDLARALARLAGAANVEPTAGSAQIEDLIGPAEHLVFVLADGLGSSLIESFPEARFLAEHVVADLQTVFPSSTPVALTALATGEWPSHHGVTGWWTHLPEIAAAGALMPFITRNGQSLLKAGLTAERALPRPVLLPRLPRDVLALFSVQFVDTSASRYFTGGCPQRGYWTLADAVDRIHSRIEAASSPTYTYVYAPRVDLAAHRHGVGRHEVRTAVAELSHELARLAARLGGQARVVLSADHGLSDTPPDAKHLLRPTPELFEVLRYPPTGDARVLFLHLQAGAEEHARKLFRDRVGDCFLLIPIADVEALELLGPGPLSSLTRSRAGDLMAISTGLDVVEYAPIGTTGRVMASIAHHSGLTPEELRVPLVVI